MESLVNGVSSDGNNHEGVNIFEYQDGKGNVIYRCKRKEGSEAELERPNGLGGWFPFQKFSDITAMPYQYDKVEKAIERLEFIVLCDNESEVEQFRLLGITATCTVSGQWKDAAKELFGAMVIIFCGINGPDGLKKTDIDLLLRAGVADFNSKVMEVLEDDQSILDWLQGTSTRDGLIDEIVKHGRPIFEYTADEDDDSAAIEEEPCEIIFEPMILKDWKDTIKETVRLWIVDKILPAKSLSLISALPKTGKSTWSYSLAEAVSNGKPFMGHQVKQTSVLILALEEMDIDVKIRTLEEMHFNQENTFIWNGPLKCNREILERLEEFIEGHHIGL